MSPGSRCAPLTLAFARHSQIQTFVIPDERSAGYIALGMAQNLRETIGLVCTSGTALLNLYPAIAEAFFQEIPLIVLTADRPPEWVDQWDGQTIFQNGVYGSHVKKSFTLPVDVDHEDSEKLIYQYVSEALNLCVQNTPGPVHINIPLREPFYPESGEEINFDTNVPVIHQAINYPTLTENDLDYAIDKWKLYRKKLILVGQNEFDPNLVQVLSSISEKHNVPVIGDIISNIHTMADGIRFPDLFLSNRNADILKTLQPDLLITLGKSVISKNLKIFLRKYQATEHWHLQTSQKIRNPFLSLTKVLYADPIELLREIEGLEKASSFEQQQQSNFKEIWQLEERKVAKRLDGFFLDKDFGEWEAAKEILESLPTDSIVHLANSMPVRYANFCGLKSYQQIKVFSNRGTSGIDGCTSTAMGFAMSSKSPVVLLTGDVAFFYDRNAFWHNYPFSNLRVIVLNNHGGGIFRIIKGPSNVPELDEYFETHQKLSARHTAEEFDMDYFSCSNSDELSKVWDAFFNFDGKPKLLEIETDSKINRKIFDEFQKITENL